MTAHIDDRADGAQDDFTAFAAMVGRPVTPLQAEAMALETRHTALLAPRQSGKSYALATRAAHWAFTKERQEVLVLSAREDTAKNLLRVVRQIAAHPMLRASIVEDLKTRLELSNGSAIEAVSTSEAAIRGRSVEFLICDEAAFVPAELIESAAIPTTMARPDARIILASTPWGSQGTFFEWFEAGLSGDDPDTRSFRWALKDCPWIVPSVIESLRRRLSPLRYRAEVLGELVGTGDSFFSLEDIDAAMAAFPMTRDGRGAPATMGCDWGGGERDLQALAIAGVLADGGISRQAIVAVPYLETSRRGYTEQEDEIADIATRWNLTVFSESKGVGIPCTRNLVRKLPRTKVVPVRTSERIKEEAYTRVQHLMAARQIVLPEHAELRKQLAGIVAKPLPLGGLRIEARTQAVHDDLADALCFAVWGLPDNLASPPEHDFPEGTQWAQTPGGIRIPLPVTTVRADLSYGEVNHGFTECPECHFPYPSYKETCQYCSAPNPQFDGRPGPGAIAAPATVPDGEAVPAGNVNNLDLWRCPAGHLFDHRFHDQCPTCHPGGGGSRIRGGGPGPGGGLPPGLASRLGPFLGPRR